MALLVHKELELGELIIMSYYKIYVENICLCFSVHLLLTLFHFTYTWCVANNCSLHLLDEKTEERELRGLPKLIEKSEKWEENIGELPPVLTYLLSILNYPQMCSFSTDFNMPTMTGLSRDE